MRNSVLSFIIEVDIGLGYKFGVSVTFVSDDTTSSADPGHVFNIVCSGWQVFDSSLDVYG